MTLIVARCTSKSILLVSDSKLTLPNSTKANPYLPSHLKIARLGEDRIIAFSGSLEVAKDVLSKISSESKNQEVIETLRAASLRGIDSDTTDFLFARLNPQPTLLKITNGTASKESVSWIGDHQAFEEFQKYFAGNLRLDVEAVGLSYVRLPDSSSERDSSMYARLIDSMRFVLESGSVSSVGGLVVAVYTQNSRIEFGQYGVKYRPPLEMGELNGSVQLPFGPEIGAFEVNFSPIGERGFGAKIPILNKILAFEPKGTLLLPVLEERLSTDESPFPS